MMLNIKTQTKQIGISFSSVANKKVKDVLQEVKEDLDLGPDALLYRKGSQLRNKDTLVALEVKEVYTCVSRGWRRDLTRECVEPNPGPKGMKKFFDEVAHEFDNAMIARDALVTIEDAIRQQYLPGGLGFTDEHVKTFFETNAAKVTKTLITGAADVADLLDDAIRARLKLSQAPLARRTNLPEYNTKTFAHGATVNLVSNFFVPRESVAQLVFCEILRRLRFVTLRGGSQSGKSTLALSIMHKYEAEFTFIYINLAAGGYIPKFWERLTAKLKEVIPEFIGDTELTQHTFLLLLKIENLDTIFRSKRVVFIIDELALALAEAAKTNSPTTEFFNAIREIKTSYNNYCVEAVMAIGVFGTLSNERDELSPLRLLSDIVNTIPFTIDEVFALFGQYSVQSGKKIDDEVLNDIFSVTMGHTGFVGHLGHVIETRFVSKPSITYQDWRHYFVWGLDLKTADIGHAVREYFVKYPNHAEYLRNTLLLTPQFQLVNDPDVPIVDALMKAAIVSEVFVQPASPITRGNSIASDRADGFGAMMSATTEPLSERTEPMSQGDLSTMDDSSTVSTESMSLSTLPPADLSSNSSGSKSVAMQEVSQSLESVHASDLHTADLATASTESAGSANPEYMDTTASLPATSSPSGDIFKRELPEDLAKEIEEFNNLPPLNPAHTVATPAPTVDLKKVIQFSSPIMRSLVMQILSPTDRPIADLLFKEWLDFVTLVVPMMDLSQLKRGKLLSTKCVSGSFLASEHAYHYEYHSKLNWLLPSPLGAQPQVGGSKFKMGTSRLDMVINANLQVGIELSAHTTLKDNQDHVDRYQQDYKALKLNYCGVIHFTSDKDSTKEFPKLCNKQHFTHVYHNDDFTEFSALDSTGISLDLEPGKPFILRNGACSVPNALAPILNYNPK